MIPSFVSIFLLFLRFSVKEARSSPVAGGPGYALYFDHQRSDTVSWKWDNVPENSVTFETWVHLVDPHSEAHTLFSYGAYDSSRLSPYEQANELFVMLYPGFVRIFRSGARWDCKDSGPEFPGTCDLRGPGAQHKWVHIAYTFDAQAGEMRIYTNGLLAGAEVRPAGDDYLNPLRPRGGVIMGHEQDAFMGDLDQFQALDGMLDDWRFWNVARSQDEIRDNFRIRLDPLEQPVGLLNVMFSFDEVKDESTDPFFPNLANSGGNNGLYGNLPNLRNEMRYSTGRPNDSPSQPKLVASRVETYGGPIIHHVLPGSFHEIELRSHDPDGQDLITVVVSSPSPCSGNVTENGELLGVAGEILSTGSVVIDADRTENKRVVFRAPAAIHDTWCVEFNYLVQDPGGHSANATVVIKSLSADKPPSKEHSTSEDGPTYLVLGGVSLEGRPVVAVITSLPLRGTLYQVQFQAGLWSSYNTIDYTNLSMPITAPNTIVLNRRGLVVFVPNKDDFEANEIYANFTYAWRLDSHNYTTEDAVVNLFVTSLNDAPQAQSQVVSVSPGVSDTIQLSATDIDSTFATSLHFKVVKWPRFGTLHQNGELIENIERVPFVVAFASNIPAFHEETQTPAFSSQFSQCGNCCFIQKTCTMDVPECAKRCTTTAWHITQALGPPDFYPKHGDTKLGWDVATENFGKEFGVFEFPDALYIKEVAVFETLEGGAVERISGSRVWEGGNTRWSTLWEGTPGPVPPEARIFSPHTCPVVSDQFKFIKLDLDTQAVPGWNNYDAIRIRGSFEFPPGQVISSEGRVVYRPLPGLHMSSSPQRSGGSQNDAGEHEEAEAASEMMFYDKFAFTASDCVDEGAEAEVSVSVEPPAASESMTWVSETDIQIEVGKMVMINISTEECVNILETSSLTVRLHLFPNSAMDHAQAFQVDNTPLELSSIPSDPLITDQEPRFLLQATSDQFDELEIEAWLDSGDMVCRTLLHIRAVIICPPGTYSAGDAANPTGCDECPRGTFSSASGKTECTVCAELPEAQNYYQDLEGQTSCKHCPEGSERRLPSSGLSIVECVCRFDHFQPEGLLHGAQCEPCPEGGVCLGFQAHNSSNDFEDDHHMDHLIANAQPFPQPGFWGDPSYPTSFLECAAGNCPGGYECADGRKGILCSAVTDGHATLGGFLAECPGGYQSTTAVIGTVVLIVVVAYVFIIVNTVLCDFASVQVFFDNLQVLAIVTRFKLRWNDVGYLKYLTIVFELALFSVDVVKPDCVMTWTFYESFLLQNALLVYMILVYLIPVALRLLFIKEENLSWKFIFFHDDSKVAKIFDRAINKINSAISILYPTLLLNSMAAFVCFKGVDGDLYLSVEPEFKCGSSKHVQLQIISGFMIPILFILPLLHLGLLLYYKKKNVLHHRKVLDRFGSLYDCYTIDCAYFGALYLIRLFLLATLQVLVADHPPMQALVALLLNILAFAIHIERKPFNRKSVNHLETGMTFVTIVFTAVGQLMYSQEIATAEKLKLSWSLIGLVGICLLGMIWIIYKSTERDLTQEMSNTIVTRVACDLVLNDQNSSPAEFTSHRLRHALSLVRRSLRPDATEREPMTGRDVFLGLIPNSLWEEAFYDGDTPSSRISLTDHAAQALERSGTISTQDLHVALEELNVSETSKTLDGVLLKRFLVKTSSESQLVLKDVDEILTIDEWIRPYVEDESHTSLFSSTQTAHFWRGVLQGFPDLLEWLSNASQDSVSKLASTLDALCLADLPDKSSLSIVNYLHCIVKKDRSSILYWLCHAPENQRRQFFAFLDKIAKSNG